MNDRCAGVRRSLAAFLAGVGGCGASAAPALLSDAVLDGVTAGTTQRALVESGKPPAVVVADGARYVFHVSQSVRLAADAQTGLRALNVTGAGGSDVGNAINILAADSHGERAVSQSNALDQTEGGVASLGRATLAGANVTLSSRSESRFSDGRSTSAVTGRRVHSAVRTSDTHTSAMSVPEFLPLQKLELDVDLPTLAPITTQAIELDLLNDDLLFGIAGSIGPFTIEAPELSGTLTLDGPDVVFDGEVFVGRIDFGTADLKLCFAACFIDLQDVDLGEIGGQTINLDKRFAEANPFKDVRINAGFGLALVGAGSVDVQPAHIHLSAELSLDLPDPTLDLKWTIPRICEETDCSGDVVGPWEIDAGNLTIETPPITVSHTFIDEDVGFAYSATFDGVLCLAVGTTDCGSASQQTERHETFVDVAIDTTRSSSYSEQGGSMSEQVDTHAGASLRDAEADLIAMSSASAEIVTDNTVSLDDSAQRGLQAANAVNAADAIVGNALNVAVLQPSSLAPRSAIGALNQSNVFSQYRTQYGL